MKKSIFLSVLAFCLLVLAACGKTEEEVVYYDFQVESRMLEGAEVSQTLLGRQYYQGEPVCVLGELVNSEEKGPVMDVFLQPEVEYAAAFPVNRKAFDRMAQEEMKAGAVEKIVTVVNGVTTERIGTIKGDGKDLTQEKIDDIIRYLEDVKALPIRTEPLITIIQEETADYFSGLKSREEIIDVLQNRVQLYLDEQKTDK